MSAAADFGAPMKGQWTPAGYVPAFYIQSPHEGEDLKAVVTFQSVPISVNREVLTIGMCPPPFRWAIGPAVDGYAEVISQDDFERQYKRKVREEYASRNAAYEDDVDKEPIPRVERYVAKKWDTNLGRVVSLGANLDTPAPEEPKMLYSRKLDRQMTPEEAEVFAKEQEKEEADLKAENEALKARLAALEGAAAVPTEDASDPEPDPAPPPKTVSALCGKPCKNNTGKSAHERRCSKCAELREEA